VEDFVAKRKPPQPAMKARGSIPYVSPQLTQYGRIADLTRAVDFKGKADGGAVLFMRKT
jgi:hypothetical protein